MVTNDNDSPAYAEKRHTDIVYAQQNVNASVVLDSGVVCVIAAYVTSAALLLV